MTLRIGKKKAAEGLAREIEERTGIDLSVCFQCKKCSSGCPVGELVESPPSEIMRRLHLGAGDELLDSELIWTCASCETCSTRCPMNIEVATVMDTLRAIARERKAKESKGRVPTFNKAFLNSVRRFGRSYEIGMITAYKLGTGTFMQDVNRFPQMLMKRKISLLPSMGANRKTVKRIFKNTLLKKGTK